MHVKSKVYILLVLFAAVSASAFAQDTSLIAQLEAANLAPTGTLRVAFLGTNPIQGRVDDETGKVTGPVADIAYELAGRIGASVDFLPMNDVPSVMASVNRSEADLGFLAYEEGRAELVEFAGPYAMMTSSYLVAANSPLQSSADVDTEGKIIATVIRRSQEVFLSGHIANADLEIWDTQPPDEEIERMLVAGEISAVGQNRQRSVEHAAKFPSLRVIDDYFMAVPQAFVIRRGESAKAEALNRFMDELRGNGFVQASLENAQLLDGASVAPPGIP